jgi:hypothetical protein
MGEFDDNYTEDELDDEDFSPEDVAKIKRSIQDANMGLTYLSYKDEETGEYMFKCNKCKRSATMEERPFPHKLDCPMRKH